MSIEQIARDVVTNMAHAEKMKGMLTSDAMASGGVLPQPIPAMEALKVTAGLTTAFPDLKFDIQAGHGERQPGHGGRYMERDEYRSAEPADTGDAKPSRRPGKRYP